jgi:FixJ family two-component response regulator
MSTLTAHERVIVAAALKRGVDAHDIAYDLDVQIEAVEALAAEIEEAGR